MKEGKGQCEVQNVDLKIGSQCLGWLMEESSRTCAEAGRVYKEVDEEQGSGGSERKPKWCGKYCGFFH